MWIFLNNAFVSAVQHTDHPNHLLVRARCDGDLERFFEPVANNIDVKVDAGTDYKFRTVVNKGLFEAAVRVHAQSIDYPNFKNSIDSRDYERHDAYLDVWTAMYRYQSHMERINQSWRKPSTNGETEEESQ